MYVVDIHSHILPGVDDGSHDMPETLQMLRIAAEEGITHMFATPHYQSGRFFTSAQEIEQQLEKIRRAAGEAGIPVRLYTGTEIYYRSELESRLDQGLLATMNGTERVLTEFSPTEDFGYMRNAVEDIRSMGYLPILAHAERYQCLFRKEDKVRELRGMGCEIQVNAGSVAGEFGLAVKKFLHILLKLRLVDYIGTDAHNTGKRGPRVKKCVEILYKKYDREYAEAVLYGNAMKNLMIMRERCEG